MRKSSISISCNLAEGFHRRYRKDSMRFYNTAESSLEELKCQLLVARDLAYISTEDYENVVPKTAEVGFLLYRWMQNFKE